MISALVFISLLAQGSAAGFMTKKSTQLAPDTQPINSLDQIKSYWHSVQNDQSNGPSIFDITSRKQVQTAQDAGVFGILGGQVTLEQGGKTYKGTLTSDC